MENIISGFSREDKKFMKFALKLAVKARGETSPNPLVGAVIAKDGMQVSCGYHKKAGMPHAEIEAINLCGDKKLLIGSSLYVTLEPCSFYGKTPPCTEAIIKNGFKEVIISTADPNPKVNGKGVKELQEAGIKTRIGLFEKDAQRQNEIFFKHITTKMPFVTIKIASSIDGRTAAANGHSRWITSQQSRMVVQKLRYEHDCVLTGINTIIADDALLYPRNIKSSKPFSLKNKKFYRVILDSNLKIDAKSKIVDTANIVNTVIFASDLNKNNAAFNNKMYILQKKGVEVHMAPPGLDLKFVLKTLYDKFGITSVLVESGQSLAANLVKNGLVDKFIFFLAPKIIGSDSMYGMFSDLDVSDVNKSVNLEFINVKQIGDDIKITAYPKKIIKVAEVI